MKTEKEIKAHIHFLEKDVKKMVESEDEEIARLNQIEALKWVLRGDD